MSNDELLQFAINNGLLKKCRRCQGLFCKKSKSHRKSPSFKGKGEEFLLSINKLVSGYYHSCGCT